MALFNGVCMKFYIFRRVRKICEKQLLVLSRLSACMSVCLSVSLSELYICSSVFPSFLTSAHIEPRSSLWTDFHAIVYFSKICQEN